jgi:hypothetical protein
MDSDCVYETCLKTPPTYEHTPLTSVPIIHSGKNEQQNFILFYAFSNGPRDKKKKKNQGINISVRTISIFMYVKDHRRKVQLLN